MAKLLISCEKATELIERKIEGDLQWGERLSLGFHTMICGLCRIYQQQSQRLHRFLAHQYDDQELESRPMSSAEIDALKTKIRKNLGKELDE